MTIMITATPKNPGAGGNASAMVRCNPNREKRNQGGQVTWECNTPDHKFEVSFKGAVPVGGTHPIKGSHGSPQTRTVTGGIGAYPYEVKVWHQNGTFRGTLDPFIDVS